MSADDVLRETEEYRRALAADRHLEAIDDAVTLLCDLVRKTDTMCSGCVWEKIVKPLTLPWVGWERGYAPESIGDTADDRAKWKQAEQQGIPVEEVTFITLSNYELRAPTASASPDETWMRSMEAFDAVTDVWLAKLQAADPGNGHGLHSGRRKKA